MRPARRISWRRGTALLLLLLFALLGCRRAVPSDPALLVPADAPMALILPPMQGLSGPLNRFSDGIEGTGGLFEYIRRRFGVDLSTPDGLAEVGIEPRVAVAVFQHAGYTFLAAGVADTNLLSRHLGDQLRLFGYADSAPFDVPKSFEGERSVAGALRFARGRSDETLPAVVYGIQEGRLLLALAHAPGADATIAAATAVTKLYRPAPESSLLLSPAFLRAAGQGGPTTARLYLDIPRTVLTRERVRALTAPLGLPGMLVGSVLRSFEGLGVALSVADNDLTGVITAARGAKAEPALTEWVAGRPGPESFCQSLPSSTAVLVRAHLDLARLTALPHLVRRALLGSNPLTGLHSVFARFDLERDILPHLTGNLAVAVLGLDDSANLVALQRAFDAPERVGDVLHFALLFEVRDPAALRRAVTDRLGESGPPGASALPLAEQGSDTLAFRLEGGRQRDLGVLLAGRTAAIVIGAGELSRLAEVVEGRAPALCERPRAELAREVVGSGTFILGGHLAFDRIARQLACKGFPPYFLKILTSPDTVAWSLDTEPDAVVLRLEVAQ